ncbi:MAG: hypothetical protein KGP28_01755, partial [Bdellovibrionales bacterium]|nr:hypothetical protein [Bdellovibrionales bacterium]
MKTRGPIFVILTLALLSACQSKQQLTAQPGHSDPGKKSNLQVPSSSPTPTPTPPPASEPKATDLQLQS